MPPRAKPVTRKRASTTTSQADADSESTSQWPSRKKPRSEEPAASREGIPGQEVHQLANNELRRSTQAGKDPHPAKSAGLVKQTRSEIQGAAAKK